MSACPNCGYHIENPATKTRRLRRLKGECVNGCGPLSAFDLERGHIRCAKCRETEATKARLRRSV